MWILSFFSIIFITQHFFRIAAFEDVPKYETVKFINLFNSRDEDSDGDSDEDDGDTDKCRFSDAFVPNRSNCNQFYICGSDKMGPMLGLCPPGMWFDPEHTENDDIVCIYPEVACTNSQIEMFKYCRCRELFPSGVQASNAKNNDVFIESSPLCIVDNEFHVYASAVDCERYFVCYNGNVKRMQCKAGLHFNAAESYCDDPTRANCNVSSNKCNLRSYIIQ